MTARQRVALGALGGLFAGFLLTPLWSLPLWYDILTPAGVAAAYIAPVIAGIFLAMEKKAPSPIKVAQGTSKLCDTSVLIDGRIADMAVAGFVEGELIIPQFILRELQGIADSSEQLKRNRGRRGLDIVKRLQEIPGVSVSIPAKDYADEREVDHKLILLAEEQNASLITNDFNLNKLARVRSVKVLNLNDLVNALKTIFLPGEEITINVTRAGKEQGQGIAYLEDGTMVVIDSGASHVGKTIRVVVTNIHQTTAGRMIFTKFEDVVSRRAEERTA